MEDEPWLILDPDEDFTISDEDMASFILSMKSSMSVRYFWMPPRVGLDGWIARHRYE